MKAAMGDSGVPAAIRILGESGWPVGGWDEEQLEALMAQLIASDAGATDGGVAFRALLQDEAFWKLPRRRGGRGRPATRAAEPPWPESRRDVPAAKARKRRH